MPKNKGAAREIDAAEISPAWKVLQMKLNEEKANKERELAAAAKETAEKSSENGFVEVVSKKNKNKRKRKLQQALEEVQSVESDLKKMKSGEVVIAMSKEDRTTGAPTPILAIDCEYVGGGLSGRDDMLARVSIVNEHGAIVYDKFVKPMDKVTDYRTFVSGIRPQDLQHAIPFQIVQKEVFQLLKDKIIVGHALHNDFRVLNLTHKRKDTRDTAKCSILKELAKFKKPVSHPSLKLLAKEILGIDIQIGSHDSVTDARVALRLYMHVKKRWEADIKRFHRQK